MTTPPQGSLRGTLTRSFVGLLAALVTGTLIIVAAMSVVASNSEATQQRHAMVKALESRGRLLAQNHALALRPLAADHMFGAINGLLSQTIDADDGVVLGVFLGPDGRVWARAFPALDKTELTSAGLLGGGKVPDEATTRSVELGGETVLVFTVPLLAEEGDEELGDEPLGTIVYGLSTAGMLESLASARSAARTSLFFTLLMLALLGVVTVLIGYWRASQASRRIAGPLAELTSVANAIALGEHIRATISSGDEVEILANAFNRMLQAQEQNALALEKSRNEALEASRLKDEFMANISHEIRTPMNGVIGMVKLLLSMEHGEKVRRYIEVIDSSSVILMTLINDILDFSKMQSGKFELRPVDFHPTVLVEDVCELMAAQANAKGVELVLSIGSPFPSMVRADAERLRQIITNLVGNAIKFTDEGQIIVSARVNSDDITVGETLELSVTIEDSGIGISEQGMAQLFQAFTQVDGSMIRAQGGTGLGLTISKQLAEMMGGDVTAESELGKGSKFTVQIQVKVLAGLTALDTSLNKKAMIVESNESVRRMLIQSLQAWGLSTSEYEDVESALAALQKWSFDVVILGGSPSTSVVDFLFMARNTHWGAEIPIILLSQVNGERLSGEVAQELRAQIAKPVRSSELYNHLVGIFEGEPVAPTGQLLSEADNGSGIVLAGLRGRVLVVDDNKINQFVASEMLESLGFSVEVVGDGKKAVERTEAHEYDIVFMDCQMPIMDGYTATQEIRNRERQDNEAQHTQIVALTAHAMAGERQRVLDAGMDEYLAKPIQERKLKKLLRNLNLLGNDGRAHASLEPREEAQAVSNESPRPNTITPKSLLKSRRAQATLADVPRSARLIEIFLESVPGQLEDMAEAVKAADAEAVMACGHKLKSGCRSLGATVMAELAETLEHLGRDNKLEQSADYMSLLFDEFAGVGTQLLTILATTAERKS